MLEIGFAEKGTIVIVSIAGELSMRTVSDFDLSFKKYINSGFEVVALDLQYMSFLDSFGMNRIIKISRPFVESGKEFVLINMNDAILNTFRIAAFDTLFAIMSGDDFRKKYLPGE